MRFTAPTALALALSLFAVRAAPVPALNTRTPAVTRARRLDPLALLPNIDHLMRRTRDSLTRLSDHDTSSFTPAAGASPEAAWAGDSVSEPDNIEPSVFVRPRGCRLYLCL
ncbi:hypothetical protein GGX14DRAFT_108411 [Mycena pura]|uniref:Uncharacterized protein n=1 Tax=Mycena pura TaxID=153505 RepID=A0AAD6VDE7_9AGAR|nr:hypothetical protein GGX14DRAFT_108411 [Mycena pura]